MCRESPVDYMAGRKGKKQILLDRAAEPSLQPKAQRFQSSGNR